MDDQVAKSIADAPLFAAERGHVVTAMRPSRAAHLAAVATCSRCRRRIMVDDKGAIRVPTQCRPE